MLQANFVLGLRFAPGSLCERYCVGAAADDNAASTADSGLSICSDEDFDGTLVGERVKECISCLRNSDYAKGDEDDLSALFCEALSFLMVICEARQEIRANRQ